MAIRRPFHVGIRRPFLAAVAPVAENTIIIVCIMLIVEANRLSSFIIPLEVFGRPWAVDGLVAWADPVRTTATLFIAILEAAKDDHD